MAENKGTKQGASKKPDPATRDDQDLAEQGEQLEMPDFKAQIKSRTVIGHDLASKGNPISGKAGGVGQTEGEKHMRPLPRFKDQVMSREVKEEGDAKAGPEFKDQARPVNRPPFSPQQQQQLQASEAISTAQSSDNPVVAFLVDSTIVQGDRVILENNTGTPAEEANGTRHRRRKTIGMVLAAVVIVAIVVAGTVCGTGACGSGGSSDAKLDAPQAPTAPPTLDLAG